MTLDRGYLKYMCFHLLMCQTCPAKCEVLLLSSTPNFGHLMLNEYLHLSHSSVLQVIDFLFENSKILLYCLSLQPTTFLLPSSTWSLKL